MDAATVSGSEMEPTADTIKSYLDDDVYKAFQRCFFVKGKGRRPALPPISSLTNKLLLQLFFLKEENQSTFADIKTWLDKIIPSVATVTESRIHQRIVVVKDACSKLDINEARTYLDEVYDFNSLHPALTALGLSRLHLINAQPYTTAPTPCITNEVVVCLDHARSKLNEQPIFVRKWLQRLSSICRLTDKQLCTKVTNVLKTYSRLSRKTLDEKDLFLKELFFTQVVPLQTQEQPSCKDCCDLRKQLQDKNFEKNNLLIENHRLFSENNCLLANLDINKTIIHELQAEKYNLSIEISNILERKNIIELELETLRSSLIQEKEEKEKLKVECDNLKTSNMYKKNFLNKNKIFALQEEKDVLLHTIADKESVNSNLNKEIVSLRKKVKSEQTLKSKYKISLSKQKCMNVDLSKMFCHDDDNIELREGCSSHRYSDRVRKTFYALQDTVPVTKCAKVISTVAKNLFNSDICENDLPSKSTALNMSSEAQVIAKEQVIDEIMNTNTNHFTYACDGTSRDKAHYLEKHLVLSNGKMLSLGYSQIATDDSDTLLEQCVASFKDLCNVYCKDKDIDEVNLLKEIITKMKCLMTDRASVCKAFDAKMSDYKHDLLGGEDATTFFIFCNAHFLLALSAAAGTALINVQKEDGIKFGRDALSKFNGWKNKGESVAGRVIRLAASLVGPRCDEKSGCREEWLAYCASNQFKSTFTSHRSNRFNNLFANATALLRHRASLLLFLKDCASHSNLKFDSVIADLEDDKIMIHVGVLSFLHIYFTEPYWLLMNSSKPYGKFHLYVKKMRDVLTHWVSVDFDPIGAASVFVDFKCNVDDAVVFNAYFESIDRSYFIRCLCDIVQMFLSALHRQLNDFLEDGVFGGELDSMVEDILNTCPLTNLTGERLFGDLDYDLNKRRNTSLHLRTTTSMWKHNRTSVWLDKKGPSLARKLVNKAIKYSPMLKKNSNEELRSVKEKIKQKIRANKLIKDKKANKLRARQAHALDAILEFGGQIAESKNDLDTICAGPRSVAKLKAQIRYRTLIRGEKISLAGNRAILYNRLLSRIDNTV